MKTFTMAFIGLLVSHLSTAQPPALIESFNYGGNAADNAYGSWPTSDGGVIICGSSTSSSNDVGGNYGSLDAWVVKVDGSGSIVWGQNYGGSAVDFARAITETADGDYVFVGHSTSSDFDLTENAGGSDLWLVKIGTDGTIIWQKTYGGSDDDFGISIKPTSDGGLIAAGNTFSSDGDVDSNSGNRDIWVTKFDAEGELEWEQTYGGSLADAAISIIETPGGDYAVTGSTASSDGDVTSNNGETDAWVIFMDEDGELIWQNTVGGSLIEASSGIVESGDGGFVVSAQSQSSDGDLSSNLGGYDLMVFKLNSMGELDWVSTYGGSENDFGVHALDAIGEGFIITGNSASSDGDVSSNSGEIDGWIIRVDDEGSLLWESPFGGIGTDRCLVNMQRENGGFRVLGTSSSADGDVGGNFGNNDFWLMELGQDPLKTNDLSDLKFSVFPNPATSQINIELNRGGHFAYMVVTDISGRVLESRNIRSDFNSLDISAYAEGLYLISIEQDGQRIFKKFIVAHK